MGNRTYLYIPDIIEYGANNCVPIAWLALFQDDDFSVQPSNEGDTATFATTCSKSCTRVQTQLQRLENFSALNSLYHHLSDLWLQLNQAESIAYVEFDVTQMHFAYAPISQVVRQLPSHFDKFLAAVEETESKAEHMMLLNQLLQHCNLHTQVQFESLSEEEQAFILIGTDF